MDMALAKLYLADSTKPVLQSSSSSIILRVF
jgi:hypothetical protein